MIVMYENENTIEHRLWLAMVLTVTIIVWFKVVLPDCGYPSQQTNLIDIAR